jgi:hypothetical protein
MFDGIMISIVLLLLMGVVFICVVASVMPLFINRANAEELMPIARKAAKAGVVMAAICGVLELVSPGSVIRAAGIDITTAVLFVWSIGLIYLLKYRDRRLRI